MAGYEQNLQFPGSQPGFPPQTPAIPIVPTADNHDQAGGGPLPVAAPATPAVQTVSRVQPIPVAAAGRQPTSAYPASSHGSPETVGPPNARSASRPCFGPVGRDGGG